MADDGQMVMAGLWAKWKSPKGEEVLSCTVLTCAANKIVGELHDRKAEMARRRTGDRRRIARLAQALCGRGLEGLAGR